MHPLQCSRSCPLLMISLLIKSLAEGSFPFVSYLVFWVFLGMEQFMSWLFPMCRLSEYFCTVPGLYDLFYALGQYGYISSSF
jgi:hypothetical protein